MYGGRISISIGLLVQFAALLAALKNRNLEKSKTRQKKVKEQNKLINRKTKAPLQRVASNC